MNKVKKTILLGLIITLITFSVYQPTYAEIIPIKLLDRVEEVLYGQISDLSIMERIENLEKTLYNKTMEGSLVERAHQVINFVLPQGSKPSLIFLVNTLEWSLSNNVSHGVIIPRIEKIEKLVYGKVGTGPLSQRLERLAKLSLPGGRVPVKTVTIPKNTLIKIKLLNTISSTESQLGQIINYKIVEDLIIEDSLVIPAGTTGTMKVESVQEAGSFGRDGKVKLEFSNLYSIDGSPITVELGEEAGEKNKSLQLAVGVSLLGTLILSNPVGIIAGFFVKGKEEDLPAGTEIYIQTVKNELVNGIELR